MTTLKIAAIAGSMIVAAGGSAAVATRNKWWPKEVSDSQDLKDKATGDSGPLSPQDNSTGQGNSRSAPAGQSSTVVGSSGTADQKNG